jgi:hypothetical protein
MATFVQLYSTRLDQELGSSDTNLFTTVKRKAAINDAMRWFNTQTEALIRTGSFSVSDGTSEYDLEAQISAGDFIKLATKYSPEVWIAVSGQDTEHYAGDSFPRRDVEWLNRYELGWRNQEGYPSSWYVRHEGGTVMFGIYPTPDVQSGETWTAKVPYVAEPTDMSADADIPFTVSGNALIALEPWHDALVYYAASELEKLRKGTDRSAYLLARAEGRVRDYLDKRRVPGGKPIRMARNYRADARRMGGNALGNYGPYDDPWK